MRCRESTWHNWLQGAAAVLVVVSSLSLEAPAKDSGSAAKPAGRCEALQDRLELANAPTLLQAAETCAREEDLFAATLFLITAQIRAKIDLTLLKPADKKAQRVAAELYRDLFYLYGGPGDSALYADPETAGRLLDRVAAWKPRFGPNYNPGWAYRDSDRLALYTQFAQEQIDRRLYQLRQYAVLMVDPRYRAVQAEMANIQLQSGGPLTVGTALYEQFKQAKARLHELRKEILAGFPPPPSRRPVLDGLPPDIDPKVRQLYSGMNGPQEGGWHLFESAAEARRSWLSKAMEAEALSRVIAAVDFEREVLFAVWIGEQGSASGKILVQKLDYDERTGRWSHHVLVGVRHDDCQTAGSSAGPHPVAYPFALAIGPRPTKGILNQSTARSNFPDGCQPPVAGTPTVTSSDGDREPSQ